MTTCITEVTQEELDEITKCEAVVIREYERDDGSRFGKIIAWGDSEEMQDVADMHGIYVMPVGLHIICDSKVLVKDLI